jgi:hypothetical protein
MKSSFREIRFSLFIQSFAGFKIKQYIVNSNNQHLLINCLSKILVFDPCNLRCYILHKNCQRKFFEIKINDSDIIKKADVYLLVEKQLCQLYKEKTKSLNSDFAGDYETGLLDLALERVSGNVISDIKNDRKFDEQLTLWKTTYKSWYYQIACKYRLPTIRIIPFLLRLISIQQIASLDIK